MVLENVGFALSLFGAASDGGRYESPSANLHPFPPVPPTRSRVGNAQNASATALSAPFLPVPYIYT